MRWLALAFLLVGLLLRLESLGGRVVWYDEVYSIWAASQPVGQILRESSTSDPHPPGYYLVLHAWLRLWGPTREAARALSLVAWLASAWVLWRAAHAWFGPNVAAGSLALLSIHAFQVIASTEARMYSPLQLTGLGATWLLWRALQAPEIAAGGGCTGWLRRRPRT